MTRDLGRDGEMQIAAAMAFLNRSGLVEWDPASSRFNPRSFSDFRGYWAEQDPVFGRFICWNSFSTGMEVFLKGAFLLAGIEIRKDSQEQLKFPSDVSQWLRVYAMSKEPRETVKTYGTLYNLIGRLDELGDAVEAAADELVLVRAGFDLLRSRIRNRDAHAYVPNVRDAHHDLVRDLFCPALNTVTGWLPAGVNRSRTSLKTRT
jgi:hypothetical protein